jgi:hypothetical protein
MMTYNFYVQPMASCVVYILQLHKVYCLEANRKTHISLFSAFNLC